MDKKKLLFVINDLYGGGAEKVFQTIINHLDQDKYEVAVYSLHQRKIDHEIYKTNFRYHYIYSSAENGLMGKLLCKIRNIIVAVLYKKASPSLFYRLMIKGVYDVEIAFIEGYATKIIAGSSNKKSKKLAWVHIDLVDNPWSDIAYHSLDDQKKCYSKYDKIICVSDSVREKFTEKFDIRDTLRTLYNPLDVQEICEKSQEDIGELKKKGLRLVTAGRLVKQKGFDRLLSVCKRLKDDKLEFELWILGEGEERIALERQIMQYCLQDNVNLWGYQQNPYPYFAVSDIFVCSSRAEGYSLVVAEAMILGVPIISVDCSGPNELLGFGKYGMLVENTEEGLYNGLLSMIVDRQLRENYRKVLPERVKEFELSKKLKEIEECWNG